MINFKSLRITDNENIFDPEAHHLKLHYMIEFSECIISGNQGYEQPRSLNVENSILEAQKILNSRISARRATRA